MDSYSWITQVRRRMFALLLIVELWCLLSAVPSVESQQTGPLSGSRLLREGELPNGLSLSSGCVKRQSDESNVTVPLNIAHQHVPAAYICENGTFGSQNLSLYCEKATPKVALLPNSQEQQVVHHGVCYDSRDIYVSAFIARLLDVDVKTYTFDIVYKLVLSWRDDTALQAKAESEADLQKTGSCARYCSQDTTDCCSKVWLPTAKLANAARIPEERVVTERISVEPAYGDDGLTGEVNVVWFVDAHTVSYSDLNFDKFPFDTQLLRTSFYTDNCGFQFKPSAAGLRFTMSGVSSSTSTKVLGDDVSGWKVEGVTVKDFYTPYSDLYSKISNKISTGLPHSGTCLCCDIQSTRDHRLYDLLSKHTYICT